MSTPQEGVEMRICPFWASVCAQLRPLGTAFVVCILFVAVIWLPEAAPASTENPSNPSGAGMVGTLPYAGPHADVARFLLQHVVGWKVYKTPAQDVPPTLPSQIDCQRDAYIYAAAQAAWAANAHVAAGMKDAAAGNIALMMDSLRKAEALCSNAPAIAGGKKCQTTSWLGCDQLHGFVSK